MCDISLEPADSTKLYGVYTTLQMALDVCDSMNDYEAINHPNDIGTVTYRVEGVIPNRPSINVNTVRPTPTGGITINIPPGVYPVSNGSQKVIDMPGVTVTEN